MSRWLVLLLAMMVSIPALSAKKELVSEEDRTIAQVFPADGFTKDQIFTGGRKWVAENFRSAKAVIEYESKEDGVVIGNGNVNYPCNGAWDCLGKADWRIKFTMKLEARDGRFRLTFTNINLYWPAKITSGIRTPENDSPIAYQNQMDEVKPVLLAFGTAIQKSLIQNKATDDW